MKKLAIILLLLLPVTAFGADRRFDKSFDVGPGARFSLESYKGHVQIRTGSTSTIRVNARIYPDEGPDSDLQYVTIDATGREGYVRVEVEYDSEAMKGSRRDGSSGLIRNWNSVSLPFVDFEIVVPDDAGLDLVSHKSTYDVEAPAGEISIETHKGTGTVKRVRNDFELSTHKGEFDVEIDKLQDLEIDTHKGDIEVVIHDARDFSLRGKTDSGDLEFSGYPVRLERGRRRGAYASETTGSGAHRIELDTYKGRIKVDFR